MDFLQNRSSSTIGFGELVKPPFDLHSIRALKLTKTHIREQVGGPCFRSCFAVTFPKYDHMHLAEGIEIGLENDGRPVLPNSRQII